MTVVPEFNNPGLGRPDIALIRAGQPPRAFVELKSIAHNSNPARWTSPHDRRQFERLKTLKDWATCNFHEFRLFHRDQQFDVATVVPQSALDPNVSDRQVAQLLDRHDFSPFVDLVATLCRADAPAARNAKQLAELMAHSAKLVREIVKDRLTELAEQGNEHDALLLVRTTFREVLYAHPEAGGYSSDDFDSLFSSAFAQTLAFGLLLVRESTGQPVGDNSWRDMPEQHPLMRAALRVLSEDEVRQAMGVGFEVMCDTVNSFAAEILALREDGADPILYFYEDFLEVFDPAARERYGVYYTPIEVVRYMVGALDRALRDNLGTEGLRDSNVTILDPATGTGTFLLGVAERVRDQVTAEEGGPAAAMALRELATRMYGFELLVGPYAVAHYRLHHALRNRPPDEGEDAPQRVDLPRLGIYLADTLADPAADAPMGALGVSGLPIAEERREASRIKREQPILAIIGNPPYKRLEEGENETLVGRWMDHLWDDLKAPVREAGMGGQLNTFPEFSVAFWRWTLWKMFEADNAPGRGVIAMITNRKFLTGWPYAGLRKLMRERFDRIEVIDLRGDLRAGPRGDVTGDVGVFNIQVGTAITLCIADGSKTPGSLAEISYSDAWSSNLFNRESKLGWLLALAGEGRLIEATRVDRGHLDDMRPAPFSNGDWLSIRELFGFSGSGLQTKRDAFVYAVQREQLLARLESFAAEPDDVARKSFHDSRDRKWTNAKAALVDVNGQFRVDQSALVSVSYRAFDRRVLYNHPAFGDFLRPSLQAAWGNSNCALYGMPMATGAGPAVWCHGLLPDYHSFRGSYGGYAFPLYDRRQGPNANNLSPVLLAHLGMAYGVAVTPEDVFDAILALLSATSYSRRFAEDLEDVFPHVPFPADHEVFLRAAAIGREIRAVETFARAPEARFRPLAFCRLATEAADGDVIDTVTWADGEVTLCEGGRGRFTGLPEAIWSFSVSGYRVLPRWIEGRKGLPADRAMLLEFRDTAARIAELIHRFGEADLVLDETLSHTLTREELGFPEPDEEDAAEGDD